MFCCVLWFNKEFVVVFFEGKICCGYAIGRGASKSKSVETKLQKITAARTLPTPHFGVFTFYQFAIISYRTRMLHFSYVSCIRWLRIMTIAVCPLRLWIISVSFFFRSDFSGRFFLNDEINANLIVTHTQLDLLFHYWKSKCVFTWFQFDIRCTCCAHEFRSYIIQ